MLVENALEHYYAQVQDALRELLGGGGEPGDGEFTPGVELPELTPAMRRYLSASELAHVPMPDYAGKRFALLDLTRNPATRTTKTFASLVIVARAVRFIQDTGQRVTIVTPSSANKAIALRDAVWRAIDAGLVGPEQLNVVTVVPAGSVRKLRCSPLFTDTELRARNPIAVYEGEVPGRVKPIARHLVDTYRDTVERRAKTNLWYTLQLENYLAADVVRAHAEQDHFAPDPAEPRLHVHAVSSAYGLLGHAYGRGRLPGTDAAPSRYFLVQHLGAPDMVLSLYNDGATDPALVPGYDFQPGSGLFEQHGSPRFPAVTFDPAETLDPTFYTREPPTSARMNELIQRQGGGGIVVSLAECLNRYGEVRTALAGTGIRLPANPTTLREWSLVMAVVGIRNAIDRGLVSERDILVHGSGCYSADEFGELTVRDLHRVGEGDESLRDVVLEATAL